jgi:hypothetical protein
MVMRMSSLKIRALVYNDVEKLKELHEKYYSQFEFPEFLYVMNAFIIEDDNDIIMAGAVEKVAEVMLVTNKAKSEIKIGRALVEAQNCAMFTCARNGIRDMYAFVDDDSYAEHLIKHGFVEADKALKLRIR